MFQTFNCDGKPIKDIKLWAKERGEKMVKYRAHRKYPNIYSDKMAIEEHFGEMPESFFNNSLMSNGWVYTEIQ